MAEKKLLGKVSIPSEQKKWFRYVNNSGEVWAVKPQMTALSPEEKERRAEERKQKRLLVSAERSKARLAVSKARLALRKEPSVKNAEAFELASRKYEEIMGGK